MACAPLRTDRIVTWTSVGIAAFELIPAIGSGSDPLGGPDQRLKCILTIHFNDRIIAVTNRP